VAFRGADAISSEFQERERAMVIKVRNMFMKQKLIALNGLHEV
jgi:hypothetical protein